MSFWHTLPHPILGLAPMDGVTDAAFRYIVARYGKPDVHFTEFVSVEEICRGTTSAWRQLRFLDIERPIVAQIYGADPEKFYQATQVICSLGFDGVDINMGCPSKSVSARGCGAALIKTPALAQEIIRAVQDGVHDWTTGYDPAHSGLPAVAIDHIQRLGRTTSEGPPQPRHPLPVSVKTRLGYDTVIIEDWLSTLLATKPEVVTIHGRTLSQLYRGQADWEAIRRAVKLGRETATLILGNGDVRTVAEAAQRIRATQAHGVLIGRGALGNPWIFREKVRLRQQGVLSQPVPSLSPEVPCSERLQVALEHAHYFESLHDGCPFVAMRKHLGWYCKGFAGAADLRSALFKTTSAADVTRLFATLDISWDVSDLTASLREAIT